jgi:hypothetical protein
LGGAFGFFACFGEGGFFAFGGAFGFGDFLGAFGFGGGCACCNSGVTGQLVDDATHTGLRPMIISAVSAKKNIFIISGFGQ